MGRNSAARRDRVSGLAALQHETGLAVALILRPFSDKNYVERRREPRIQIFEPVLLTVLGPIETQHWARALDLSGRGMKLVVPGPVQPGSAVKVQLEDALLLGDVCYSEAHGNEFVVGLNIRHALMGLNELTSLNSKLLNGWLPPASAQPQTNTNSQPTAPSRTGS